jgi:hypothetical protein
MRCRHTATVHRMTDSCSYVFRLLVTDIFRKIITSCVCRTAAGYQSVCIRPAIFTPAGFPGFPLLSSKCSDVSQGPSYTTASFSCSPSDLSSSKLTTVSLKSKSNHFSKIPRAFFQATALNIPASYSHSKDERVKPRKQTVRSFSPPPHTN